ncbi:MAG: hypothetical protein LBS31_03955 [Candidatus Adiutrix sp.]|jgi:hypothetical protein|nr:hypothetical protein [Candidatus Adiutrix sp.]
MKKPPVLMLVLLASAAIALSGGCEDQPREEVRSRQEEAAAPTLSAAEEEALKARLAELRQALTPTQEEKDILNAGPAVCEAGWPESGYFVNHSGAAGLFHGYDRPFNFIWTGPVKTVRGIDGRDYDLIDGQGTLLVKYMDEDQLLQRYEGDLKNGLWHGHGRYIAADGLTGGVVHYEGGFSYDQMEGRGVYSLYAPLPEGGVQIRREGDWRGGELHGRGTMTDLNTGHVLYKGLFFEGEPFEGDGEAWQAQDDYAELNQDRRQLKEVLRLGRVDPVGWVNEIPGQGPLTIIAPDGAENLAITSPDGPAFQPSVIKNPFEDGAEIPGLAENLPPSLYPLPLIISFDLDGQRQTAAFTVKRPCFVSLGIE